MRQSVIVRNTLETKIKIDLNLDGSGVASCSTKVPFFDHMLNQIGKHSLSDLSITCDGDIEVDCHHTVEDVGIALGLALKEALGDCKGINRYGQAIIPMEEALIICAIDVCNRPFVDIYNVENFQIGNFDTEMVTEFFRAVSLNCGFNIHIEVLRGKNNHHVIEGMFKAFARALYMATSINERVTGFQSTKGVL